MASPRPAQAQAPNLGAARDFGLLADGSISTHNSLPVLGRVGATQAVAATVTATQGVSAQGADNVPAALSAAQAARVWC